MEDIDSGASSYEASEPSVYSSDEEDEMDVVRGPKPPSYPWYGEEGLPEREEQIAGLVGGRYRLIDLLPLPWTEAIGLEVADVLLGEVQGHLIPSLRKDIVYPDPASYFHVLDKPPSEARVIILGQNPYHGPNQAHGLSFSDNSGGFAPSLNNIVKVIKANGFICRPEARKDGKPKGNLDHWFDQGVFLLNTGLSVIRGEGSSHMDIGWQDFTDAIIGILAATGPPKVFCLWGKPAQRKAKLIEAKAKKEKIKHLILMSSHPSPLSFHRGFNECKHFAEANAFLRGNGLDEIDWDFS